MFHQGKNKKLHESVTAGERPVVQLWIQCTLQFNEVETDGGKTLIRGQLFEGLECCCTSKPCIICADEKFFNECTFFHTSLFCSHQSEHETFPNPSGLQAAVKTGTGLSGEWMFSFYWHDLGLEQIFWLI